MSFEQLAVGPAGVLYTTIGVMEQPLGGPAMPQRHLQGSRVTGAAIPKTAPLNLKSEFETTDFAD